MTELVIRNYWWPGITKDIEKYVDSYNVYQRMKNKTETPVEKLMVNKIQEIETYLTVDFITELLLVARKNVILVVCDRLSKIIHFIEITKEMSAKRLV